MVLRLNLDLAGGAVKGDDAGFFSPSKDRPVKLWEDAEAGPAFANTSVALRRTEGRIMESLLPGQLKKALGEGSWQHPLSVREEG